METGFANAFDGAGREAQEPERRVRPRLADQNQIMGRTGSRTCC